MGTVLVPRARETPFYKKTFKKEGEKNFLGNAKETRKNQKEGQEDR